MARRRRPAVLEALREIARWQLAPGVTEQENDVPARFVASAKNTASISSSVAVDIRIT